MRFFNAIYTLTDVVADNIAKGTQSFIENLLKLESGNANTDIYQQAEMTDKEKISEDFRRIGEDMYIALDKYEAKHGY